MLTQQQGIFCFSHCLASEEAGGAQRVGGVIAGTNDQSHLSSKFTTMCNGTLLHWRWLNFHNFHMPMKMVKEFPVLLCFHVWLLTSPVRLPLSQPRFFLILVLRFFPPTHQWKGRELSCQLGLNHYTKPLSTSL